MSEQKNKKDLRKTLVLLRDGLKHLVLHNGWLKLIAIVISICLWAGLISQDESITRDKTFQSVRVSVTGTEIMKNNKYIVVTDLEGLTADFTAAVPQKQYEAADPSAYNLRLDLSRINQVGTQEIKIDKSYSNLYGKVTSITPATVTVDVENYKIRPSIPVSAKRTKAVPEGYNFTYQCDPTKLTIHGPESIVNEVSYARADINIDDIDWVEGEDFRAFKFKLYNRAGQEIDTSKLSITSANIETDSVIVSYTILPEKEFSTRDLIKIKGVTASGYKVEDIRIFPETVRIADSSDILDQMDTLFVEKDSISVTGLKDSFTTQIKLIKPSDNSVMSPDTITVAVDIVPADEP